MRRWAPSAVNTRTAPALALDMRTMISRKRMSICSVLASELMLLAISASTSITGRRSPAEESGASAISAVLAAMPMAETGMWWVSTSHRSDTDPGC
jgi:hypothetical protein